MWRFPLSDGMRSAGHAPDATLFRTVLSLTRYVSARSDTDAHVRAIKSRSLALHVVAGKVRQLDSQRVSDSNNFPKRE